MPAAGPGDGDAPIAPDEPAFVSSAPSRHAAVVHQAAGFVGAGLRASPDDALVILEREAQRLRIDLTVLAGDVVERRRPLPKVD
ncbi:hypothetical protein [Rathayibacter sp. VKM Ac-2630]|uniref:hypothetical protein n=1 Tax=Rathayibacter sp. VKM Ac-2630 TaxID=1938617 RepID=UPI000980CC46|nr:hypothetical protein [Rathayibacter sp. VKM Ac-2630]OOB90878.1 hypothetical protein B0T42_09020 [Rathayibacter sp. VKM Ac-2630]